MSMVVNAVNVLALVVAVVILLKALAVFASPKACMKKSARMLKEQWNILVGASVVLSAVTGYYVLKNLGIVQVAAVTVFAGSVICFSFLMHPRAVVKCTKAMMKDRKMCFLAALPWIVGAVWVLYVLFA